MAETLTLEGSVTLDCNSKILGRNVKLGNHIVIGKDVLISAATINLSDNIIIDEGTRATGGTLETSSLILMEGVWVFPYCVLNTTSGLSVGRNTGIGGYSMIWTHGNWQNYLDGYPIKYEPTYIGNNVWLPWHVIIMPGIKVGDNVTFGAGTVVVKDVPANSLCVGSPGKILRSGPAEWPIASPNGSRYLRVIEIVEHFCRYIAKRFNWKDLTLKSGPIYRFDKRIEDCFEFHGGKSEKAYLVVGKKNSPEDSQTLYIFDDEAPSHLPRNWIHLKRGSYEVKDPHPLFFSFASFLTNYGIRLKNQTDNKYNNFL